uniref:Protein EARLY FLOWERING 3 isoform X1 n=1 Tax=Rhizophora mucronata TaxID=61149 RepID=A0A2P2IVH3_RHIMU
MKRGKYDDKMMGPMFPRLHVNDTDKGGPRAPPRNKMALYEQLSIPSQRFKAGVVPPNLSNSSNSVPARASSQVSGPDKNSLSFRLPSMVSHVAGNVHLRQPNEGSLNGSLKELEQRKMTEDEDDFRVPVFVKSGTDQCHGKTQKSSETEKFNSISSEYLSPSVQQNVISGHPKHIGPTDVRNKTGENLEVCVSSRDHAIKSSTSLAARKNINEHRVEAKASQNQQKPDWHLDPMSRLPETDCCLQQEGKSGLNDSRIGDGIPKMMREAEKDMLPELRSDSHSRKNHNNNSRPEIDTQCQGDKAGGAQLLANSDKSDDISETSMVDSIPALDTSPDDVVGIIGQKNFWKARRAIAK